MDSLSLELDEGLRGFIAAQRVYFVATAPLSASGHVNVSPKGLDSLRILGPTRNGPAGLLPSQTRPLGGPDCRPAG
jgi:hypothetical protein